MSYLGVSLIIFSAFLIWREYSSFLQSELAETEAYLCALRDYREKMSCFLLTPTQWALGYRDELLEERGFLPSLREGEGIAESFLKARESARLSDEADGIISDCFGRLGEGYLECELDALDGAIGRLSSEKERAAEELSKKKRALGVALGACVSGIAIMII